MKNKIGKIVELLIDWDDEKFEELGVDIMSLVESPAIGISWQAFSEEENIGMIDGIVELLNQVDDIENRKEMAKSSMEAFIEDDVEYDQDDFLKRIGLHLMPNGDLMEGPEHVEEVDPIIALASQPGFGEVLDYNDTWEVDPNKETFSDVTDTIKAIIGLDILGKKNPTDEGEIKYRYSGPTAQRDFCKSLQNLNKVYTYDEIQRMSNLNSSFGSGKGGGSYNKWQWKGGKNCRHYWESVTLYREGRKTVVVSNGPARGIAGDSMEQMGFNKSTMSQWNFSDDDQMIITGPSMTPNVLIPRRDPDGNTFHVYFSEETIEKISQKFLEENKQHRTDINHDDIITEENTLIESWIVKDPEMDKSKTLGFDVPKGTWMVSYRINNQETWDKIKDGSLQGFSITGSFLEKAAKK